MPYPKCGSWIEIDAKALKSNINFIKSHLRPGVKLGCVLKANAYGHGLKEVLPLVHGQGDVIHLISPVDALWIRQWERDKGYPPNRILVLGAVGPEELVTLANEHIEVVLGDEGWWPLPSSILEKLKNSQPLHLHIHLDTGLGREGFLPSRLPHILSFFKNESSNTFLLKGVLSHFSNTEDVTEQTYAVQQLNCFNDLKDNFKILKNYEHLEWHIAASAAALVLPQSQDVAVRVGIGLYGFWPSSETRLGFKIIKPLEKQAPSLQPVLSWKVKSQYTKWLPPGAFVGYGCTFRCERPTRIAVLPVGYFDGYPRLLSGKAYTLVDGHRCPILGRVMMNHTVIDVTSVPESPNPLCAVLIGSSGGQVLGAETVAAWADTIHYECVARLGAHLPRVIVNA